MITEKSLGHGLKSLFTFNGYLDYRNVTSSVFTGTIFEKPEYSVVDEIYISSECDIVKNGIAVASELKVKLPKARVGSFASAKFNNEMYSKTFSLVIERCIQFFSLEITDEKLIEEIDQNDIKSLYNQYGDAYIKRIMYGATLRAIITFKLVFDDTKNDTTLYQKLVGGVDNVGIKQGVDFVKKLVKSKKITILDKKWYSSGCSYIPKIETFDSEKIYNEFKAFEDSLEGDRANKRTNYTAIQCLYRPISVLSKGFLKISNKIEQLIKYFPEIKAVLDKIKEYKNITESICNNPEFFFVEENEAKKKYKALASILERLIKNIELTVFMLEDSPMDYNEADSEKLAYLLNDIKQISSKLEKVVNVNVYKKIGSIHSQGKILRGDHRASENFDKSINLENNYIRLRVISKNQVNKDIRLRLKNHFYRKSDVCIGTDLSHGTFIPYDINCDNVYICDPALMSEEAKANLEDRKSPEPFSVELMLISKETIKLNEDDLIACCEELNTEIKSTFFDVNQSRSSIYDKSKINVDRGFFSSRRGDTKQKAPGAAAPNI